MILLVIDWRRGSWRKVRDRRGVSQEKIAEELGFSRIKPNRVENGRAELNTMELGLLAGACRVRVS
jgi:transcriptional regulator with XRE-family HTH domain